MLLAITTALSGMAAVLDTRLRQAQAEKLAPIDLVSALVADELHRRQDRLLERRHKLARFRDPERALDTFDFEFNKKMNRALVYELATARFIAQREDVLFLGPPGTGEEPPRASDRPRREPAGLSRRLDNTRAEKRSNSPSPRALLHGKNQPSHEALLITVCPSGAKRATET